MARSSAQAGKSPLLPAAVSDFIRRRATEFGGIALLATAVALLAALASYSPDDPSPNVATGGPVGNFLGLPGAYAADILLRTVGLAGVAMAALAGTWGWHVASHRGVPKVWLRLAVLPLAVVLLAAALAALPVSDAWPLREGLGGVLGLVVLSRLTMFVNAVGLPLDAGMVAILAALGGVAILAHTLAFASREWRRLGWLLVGFGRATMCGARAAAIGGARAAARMLHERRQAQAQAPAGPTARRRRLEPHLDRLDGRTEGRTDTRAAERRVEDQEEEDEAPALERRDLVAPRDSRAKPGRRAQASGQTTLPLGDGGYQLPPTDLLDMPEAAGRSIAIDDDALAQNARLLESVLDDFGVRGEIVKVRPGPVVTLYELEPAPGTKSSRVIGLADDIARSMSAISVRVAVVPGRNVIGIELPNARREVVYLRELLASQAYESAGAQLPLVLGKDIGGLPVIANLERMPHLLIAGTTGSGKSVAINTMILSLLYRLTPEQCRFIMIDPKMLELSVYDDIPHLLAPVVTDPRKAIVALKWVVREMENRYRSMSTLGVRNITGYNARLAEGRKKGEVLNRRVQTGFDPDTGKPVFEDQPLDMTPLPYIVVVVDEMADLMLVAGKDIEAAIQRLAQMARAAGIHLIMATQRPSVDVITGTIKANFPTRISFQVTSKIDSRTILGEGGAEQLLGQGDMLYMAGGGRISRVHGPFVSDEDVEDVVAFLRAQGEPDYLDSVTEDDDAAGGMPGFADAGEAAGGDDGLYDQAVAMVAREGKASTSLVQRHLRIGYNRAARIIEQMESEGVISPANHAGKREVLIESR